jgi:hypothetical protein
MPTTLTRAPHVAEASSSLPRSRAYTVLMALSSVAIVLQGLWAGLFLGSDADAHAGWLEVHARGGEVALVFVVAATVIAFVRIRARRDLWLGGAVLAALLVLEAFIGGLIHDSGRETLTAVHIPLAMVIVGLAIWLFGRSRSRI